MFKNVDCLFFNSFIQFKGCSITLTNLQVVNSYSEAIKITKLTPWQILYKFSVAIRFDYKNTKYRPFVFYLKTVIVQ